MMHITFTTEDFDRLKSIRIRLSNGFILNQIERDYLVDFLEQLPPSEASLLTGVANDEPIEIRLWDVSMIEANLQKWHRLFSNLPGFDHSPAVDIVDQKGNPDWFHQNVIMVSTFSPTLCHNESIDKSPFELRFKDNGKAFFWFPTCEDARNYSELFAFEGTWKEAYYLLIETLKKGWPMEEFPEELLPLL